MTKLGVSLWTEHDRNSFDQLVVPHLLGRNDVSVVIYTNVADACTWTMVNRLSCHGTSVVIVTPVESWALSLADAAVVPIFSHQPNLHAALMVQYAREGVPYIASQNAASLTMFKAGVGLTTDNDSWDKALDILMLDAYEETRRELATAGRQWYALTSSR